MAHFFYDREQKVAKKVDGKPIPITREVEKEDGTKVQEVVPGQFETETFIRKDSFNLDTVVRTHMVDEEHVVVMLNDGHEETQVVNQKLISKNKPATRDNVEDVKGRVWIVSEISIKGKDQVDLLYSKLASI